MLLARYKCIGLIKPSLSVCRTSAINIRRISDERRATLLSKYPELSDQTARKRKSEEYIDRCAKLGLRPDITLQKVRLPAVQLEQFVRLKSEAMAARLLESEPSEKLSQQYRECKQWLKNNTPKPEHLYEAERTAVLKQFPNLALAAMRENVLGQYEIENKRILVPKTEQETADEPREFVAGTTHEEKTRYCNLALQYVVIHLIDNPVASKNALDEWKADFKRCQDTLAKALEFLIEEERAEALEKYPDLDDPEIRRRAIDDFEQLRVEMVEALDQGVQIGSAQFPPKQFEKVLQSRLKALAAEVFLPGSDFAERKKIRHESRAETLADLDVIQTHMKQRKGGWWIIPNPLAVFEWIGAIF